MNRPASAPTPFASLLTPRGRGAVATVHFEGDARLLDARPLFRAVNGRPVSDQPLGRVVFGRWGDDPPEEVVVCRTADDVLEVHCHGGETAARRILGDLASAGCLIEPWPTMLTRTVGILEAESRQALARASTIRTADILLQQHAGLLRSALEELLSEGGQAPAATHHAGMPTGSHAAGACPPSGSTDKRGRLSCENTLDVLLRWADFGLHLTRPWSVVLAGRPNVGKSSLINALVGYARSIVYDQPGTTRDVVTAETALDGWPVRLSDTAGLRAAAEELESAGIERARQQLAQADCRVLLFDTSRPPHEDDLRLQSEWPGALLVAHKCDLPNAWGDLPPAAYRVSSVTGEGVEGLAQALVEKLVPEVPAPGTPVPFTSRQVDLLTRARTALTEGDAAPFRRAVGECLNGSVRTRYDIS